MTSPSGCNAWATLDDLPAASALLHAPQQWCVYLQQATDVLWAATGRRWNGESDPVSVTVRAAPPRAGEAGWPYSTSWGHCACYAGWHGGQPMWSDGAYTHEAPVAVRMPHRDITAVTAVTLDGEAFTEWRLDGAWLARTDGKPWPTCRDRVQVTYTHGKPPPPGGVAACVELAVELGKSASDDPDVTCRLPERLQSVTRQGISFAALDDMDFLDRGLTGLYSVDLWIKSVNPKNRPQAGRVWSPDIPRARRTT